jgi:hypothetical protein
MIHLHHQVAKREREREGGREGERERERDIVYNRQVSKIADISHLNYLSQSCV